MSIILCAKHGNRWDSDKLDECPRCEVGAERIWEGPVSHEREPHCCGCWIIWRTDDELYAECNECGERRDILAFLSAIKNRKPQEGQGEVDGPRSLGSPALSDDKRDAERWQFCRQFDYIEVTYGEIVDLSNKSQQSGSRNDAAIDAAMNAGRTK